MKELVERLSALTAANDNVDTEIMIASGRWPERKWWSYDYQKHTPSKLTCSLDAALDFATNLLPGHRFAVFTNGGGKGPYAMAMRGHEPVRGVGEGATLAIALCIAAIRAKEAA